MTTEYILIMNNFKESNDTSEVIKRIEVYKELSYRMLEIIEIKWLKVRAIENIKNKTQKSRWNKSAKKEYETSELIKKKQIFKINVSGVLEGGDKYFEQNLPKLK